MLCSAGAAGPMPGAEIGATREILPGSRIADAIAFRVQVQDRASAAAVVGQGRVPGRLRRHRLSAILRQGLVGARCSACHVCVIDRLARGGIVVDPMEKWAAASDEPKALSQERVSDCQLCILLVGFRRGHLWVSFAGTRRVRTRGGKA